MGPVERLIGPEVAPVEIWQDPVPVGNKVSDSVVNSVKAEVKNAGIDSGALVRVAWASASTFRRTDFRGGANGARIRLEPQRTWEENDPAEVADVISKLEAIGNAHSVSLADMIVIGGNCGVEMAASKAGVSLTVPLSTGRGDATQEQTDASTFEVLRPHQDAFRNMSDSNSYMMVDKASMLGLSVVEMTLLVTGLRVMGGNCKAAGDIGVLTDNKGALTNDFMVNLLDMKWEWTPEGKNTYIAKDRKTGEAKWNASLVDLTFGCNPELRGICEDYACDDAKERFVTDFANAWARVMNNDSYGRF